MKASIAPAARQAAILKRRKRARGAVYALCRAAVLAGLSFVLLYPILYIFSMAFRPSDQVLDPLVTYYQCGRNGEIARVQKTKNCRIRRRRGGCSSVMIKGNPAAKEERR